MLTGLQYRILKRISPGDPWDGTESAFAGKSKLRALLGDWISTEIAGQRVVDFGCGEGAAAIELAQLGAASVIGVDIRPVALERATAAAQAAGVSDRCRFCQRLDAPADLIVSIDSFEHFADPAAILDIMYGMLSPGGRVLISFGPTWFHPKGGHLFSVCPWAHLIFSEQALIRWRNDVRSDGATRFSEVEGGLNQMTIARFERLIAASRFRLDYLGQVPIRHTAPLHNRLTREFLTALVRARLIKPA